MSMQPKKEFTQDEAKIIGNNLDIRWDQFNVDQFRRGINIELEHGKKRLILMFQMMTL